jgi:hypothetical protein
VIFSLDLVTPWTLGAAVLSGAIAAVGLMWIYRKEPEREPAPALVLVAWSIALSLGWFGFVFYALQTLVAYWTSDPFWPRIFGRFVLFLLASLSFGISAAVLVHRRRRRRR